MYEKKVSVFSSFFIFLKYIIFLENIGMIFFIQLRQFCLDFGMKNSYDLKGNVSDWVGIILFGI